MADDEGQPHGGDGCPGMWRLVRSVLDPEQGATTTYECQLCPAYLVVGPGEPHPATV